MPRINPDVSIDYVHHRLHEGDLFSVNRVSTGVNIAAPKRFLLKSPDTATQPHFIFSVEAQPGAMVEVFENPTVTVNGSALTAVNNNRRSANTAEMAVFEDPTITVDGTSIFVDRTGTIASGGKISIPYNDEFVLKQNTNYQIKVTPLADSTAVSAHFNWYEAK